MHPTLTIAKRAAYNAGTLINNTLHASTLEASAIDQLIKAVEITLIEEIQEAYPEHAIVTPNQTLGEIKDNEYHWLINPIDEITNFSKGLPIFSLSMAAIKNNKTEAALIYQPTTDELFIASKGDGAKLNDRRIRATSQGKSSPIIATETPLKSDDEHTLTQHLHGLRSLLDQFSDIRQIGCDNLALCYTACGRFDGYFRLAANPNHIKAAILIAEESGVILSELDGSNKYQKTGNIIAGPGKVYKLLAKSMSKQ